MSPAKVRVPRSATLWTLLCATLWTLLVPVSLAAPGAQGSSLRVQVRDPAGHPVVNAVVYAVPDRPTPRDTTPKAIIDQVNRRFVPRISVIQAGTAVVFPNSDNIRHSVYSFSPPKVFTLKLYAGEPASPVVFDKPGIVVLGCNIHDSMVAWVLVVDTPYFARTDGAGAATLSDLPPGNYTLRAWSNAMRQEATGEPLVVGMDPLPARVLEVPPEAADPPDSMSMNEQMEGMVH
jgi:plastocyanin